jgi:hypothetical protein
LILTENRTAKAVAGAAQPELPQRATQARKNDTCNGGQAINRDLNACIMRYLAFRFAANF